ncbi:MAG: hypothetical protein IRY91_07370 [Gemmatimonadaceae bacterium]|nr:hypothetical protein [Gemmatimonadaceae bacterium]
MGSTDWDKELAKIDRQLESMSDQTLLPAPPGQSPAEAAKRVEERRTTSTLGVLARVVLAIALGIGMLFWPYSARCGIGLFAYLGAAAMVIVAGVWTSVWTWRHRSANAHVLSLLLIFWGIVLAAQEVLPRVGYARPDAAHPAIWMCE